MIRLRLTCLAVLFAFTVFGCAGSSEDPSEPQKDSATDISTPSDIGHDPEGIAGTDSSAARPEDLGALHRGDHESIEDAGAPSPPEISIGDLPEELAGFKSYFSKYINIFGVHIVASSDTPDEKVLHAAKVMAHYLDNDKNGAPDNPEVVAEMTRSDGAAVLVMFKRFEDLENSTLFESPLIYKYVGQDLIGIETHPEGSSDAKGFDATLEEVLHLITSAGYARAYPEVFGEDPGSSIAQAMDKARGGQWMSVPSQYPESAWYHYNDITCDYRCQVVEYFYWALTSLLGAQNYGNRCSEISIEWQLCTPESVEAGDPDIFKLITNPEYRLPTLLPTGDYP